MLWVAAILGIISIGNLVVSVGVILSGTYSAQQKWAQVAIIWLLPVVGALIAWFFLLENRGTPYNNSKHTADEKEWAGYQTGGRCDEAAGSTHQ